VFSKRTLQEIADFIRERSSIEPEIGMILGSGLGELEAAVEDASQIPYAEIPHFPVPQVPGHHGHLLLGTLSGRRIMMFSGRVHYYEGYSMQEITLPVRVMQMLGAQAMIVTNAAGGINPAFSPGDLMLIVDHINLVGMVGHNPLWGPNDPDLGPRFPDMTDAYDPALRRLALDAAEAKGIPLHQGVYAMVGGPSFETPAEIEFLRTVGADAVGMSTAHEVVVARHAGLCVLGISGISNVAVGINPPSEAPAEVTHEEVLEAGKVIVPRLKTLIQMILPRV
jgi:purine-nucleoside phosphorylase